MEINWKGGIKCEGGASVEEIIKKAHSTLTTTTIKMVSAALEEAIKDDNANVTPGAAFTDKKFTYELEVPAYTQLTGFDVTRNVISLFIKFAPSMTVLSFCISAEGACSNPVVP